MEICCYYYGVFNYVSSSSRVATIHSSSSSRPLLHINNDCRCFLTAAPPSCRSTVPLHNPAVSSSF